MEAAAAGKLPRQSKRNADAIPSQKIFDDKGPEDGMLEHFTAIYSLPTAVRQEEADENTLIVGTACG